MSNTLGNRVNMLAMFEEAERNFAAATVLVERLEEQLEQAREQQTECKATLARSKRLIMTVLSLGNPPILAPQDDFFTKLAEKVGPLVESHADPEVYCIYQGFISQLQGLSARRLVAHVSKE